MFAGWQISASALAGISLIFGKKMREKKEGVRFVGRVEGNNQSGLMYQAA